MNNISKELKIGLAAPALLLVFTAIMALTSPPASADIVDDTRACFPSCTVKK